MTKLRQVCVHRNLAVGNAAEKESTECIVKAPLDDKSVRQKCALALMDFEVDGGCSSCEVSSKKSRSETDRPL